MPRLWRRWAEDGEFGAGAAAPRLVGTELLEADLLYTRYNTSGSFDRLDSFNRVEDDIWTRGIDNDVNPGYDVYRDFYDVDITWSRSSNIDLVEDKVYPSWDVVYTNDGLERLIRAQRGDWNGSAFTDDDHDEQWTLTQTGNWDHYRLDLNGNGAFNDTNDLDDDQTFNLVNELTHRDTDDDSTNDYIDLGYDGAGNLTDDKKDYKWVYDAFGRLRKVNNQSSALVAEYTYNGLGYRTGWHYDVDGDGTVEANTEVVIESAATPPSPTAAGATGRARAPSATRWSESASGPAPSDHRVRTFQRRSLQPMCAA